LYLKPTTELDLPYIYRWYMEADISQLAGCIIAQDLDSLISQYRAGTESVGVVSFTLWEGDRRLGLAEIRSIGEFGGARQGEAVAWLGESRGHGIGLRLFAFILKLAFEHLELDRLWWWVHSDNIVMNRICDKIGFPEFCRPDESNSDTRFFQVDRDAYTVFLDSTPLSRYR